MHDTSFLCIMSLHYVCVSVRVCVRLCVRLCVRVSSNCIDDGRVGRTNYCLAIILR